MSPYSNKSGSMWLREIVDANRSGQPIGLYSVCSAHPSVLRAAMRQALDDDSMLLIESTSNQVNQFGGYTGMTPVQFIAFLRSIALEAGLAPERLAIGSDHLGPYPWRAEASEIALEKACALARACVLAGYTKIHLDASMSCGGDRPMLDDETVAQRAAEICAVAERARAERPNELPAPLYVIGTEVPVPGGEHSGAQGPHPTTVEHVRRTLESFRNAFFAHELHDAWERVIGLVVQSGAEFGDTKVFDYDAQKTSHLRKHLPESPSLVYEAHSTDYQSPGSLTQMVQDHFAILKVGPWLTFAFREAVLALGAIERELFKANRGHTLSQVREALEAAMLCNPAHWRPYYHGAEEDVRRDLIYGYSDRCRYYWNQPEVQKEIDRLFQNLAMGPIPLTVISQYLPEEYRAIRAGQIQGVPEQMIQEHIRQVLRIYASACAPAAP